MKNKFRWGIVAASLTAAITLATGCGTTNLASKPVTTHVVQVVGSGKKLGIVEDPVTGMYSAGYQSILVAVTTVPVSIAQATNGAITYVTPDAVASYEVSGQNFLFGKGGSTYTVAVGPNAVNTLLGGQHQPINENFITGEVVQSSSPSVIGSSTASTTGASAVASPLVSSESAASAAAPPAAPTPATALQQQLAAWRAYRALTNAEANLSPIGAK